MQTERHREEEALRHHEEQAERHERTIREKEDRPRDDRAYHEMKEAKEVRDDRIADEERGARRAQDMEDVNLVKEANTELGQP